MNAGQWQQRVQAERAQKGVFFGSHPRFALPVEKRTGFSGLACWIPNPDDRFELKLHEHTVKMVQQVQDAGGQKKVCGSLISTMPAINGAHTAMRIRTLLFLPKTGSV